MSGEIRVANQETDDSNTLIQQFKPEDYYEQLLTFDHNCGTFGSSKYHYEKQNYCPGQNFNCKMNYEMRVEENPNPLVVFMHQMIPHHENAVNMARIALKHATAADGYDDEDLDVPGLLRDIINRQNQQIMEMKGWLSRHTQEDVSTPKFCVPPQL